MATKKHTPRKAKTTTRRAAKPAAPKVPNWNEDWAALERRHAPRIDAERHAADAVFDAMPPALNAAQRQELRRIAKPFREAATEWMANFKKSGGELDRL